METIEWFDVGVLMPDDEITVLVFMPGSDEPVWLGWHADGQWYAVDATEIARVSAWAEIPFGPDAAR